MRAGILNVLLAFNLALLILHEMDAIRAKEWEMFIGLRDLPEKTAYRVFSLLHLPILVLVLLALILSQGESTLWLLLPLNIFLIGHAVIHFLFRNNPANRFDSRYSNVLIYCMGLLALVSLAWMLLSP